MATEPLTLQHSPQQILLALGNYLNGSTFRGGAFGFKLESLSRVWMAQREREIEVERSRSSTQGKSSSSDQHT